MKNTQKGMTGIIFIAVIIIIGIIIYLFNLNTQNQPAAVVSETPSVNDVVQDDPILIHNTEIQSAMVYFMDYGTNNPDEYDFLCTSGGFINERNPELKVVSDKIIANRIIDSTTGQFASTQDEAGITCLSDSENWVLFAPFNERADGNGPEYYCVDSSDKYDTVGFDRELMQCL